MDARHELDVIQLNSIILFKDALLLISAVFYTLALVRTRRLQSATIKQEFADRFSIKTSVPVEPDARRALNLALLFVGLGVTLLGADLLVAGAVNIARSSGVSDAFIVLTIVAIGTSAPELVTMMVATYKGDRDVAIGNLIGSSTYNILVITGLTMLASPQGTDVSSNHLWVDLPLAAMVALVCLPVFKSDRLVSRAEGLAFVLAYVFYLGSLIRLRT